MSPIVYIFMRIFLVELGDKTRLATMAFTTKYGWKTALVGSILGLVPINLTGGVIGEKPKNLLPQEVIHKGPAFFS